MHRKEADWNTNCSPATGVTQASRNHSCWVSELARQYSWGFWQKPQTALSCSAEASDIKDKSLPGRCGCSCNLWRESVWCDKMEYILSKMIMKRSIRRSFENENKRGGQSGVKHFQHYEDFFPVISYFKTLTLEITGRGLPGDRLSRPGGNSRWTPGSTPALLRCLHPTRSFTITSRLFWPLQVSNCPFLAFSNPLRATKCQ